MPNEPSPALPGPGGRAGLLLFAGSVALGASVLLWAGLTRPVDGDEGLYHYASMLAVEGTLPYRDFVYPQMPYLLYPYAIAGRSLVGVRLVSVFLGIASLVLLGLLCREQGPARAGIAPLLLATSAVFAAHVPIFKSYALTIALSLLALWLVRARTTGRVFGAGLCLGFLVGTRLLYLPLPLIFAAWLAFPAEGRARRIAALLAGAILALLPCALLFMTAPERFVFDVVGHHSIRSREGAVGDPAQKWELTLWLLSRPQWIVLLGMAALGLVLRRGPFESLVLACAAGLSFMSFLPTPAYDQYFVCVIPFVILLSCPAWNLPMRKEALLAPAAILALYLLNRQNDYDVSIGNNYAHLYAHDLEEIGAVAASIREHTRPGEEILSFWSGYAVLSGTRVAHGLENCCAYGLDRMTAEQRRFNKVAVRQDVEDWIRARRHRVVQLGGYAQEAREVRQLEQILASSGYRRVYERHGRSVFVRGRDP